MRLFVTSLLMASLPVVATAMTLDEAMVTTLDQNPNIRQAAQTVVSSKEGVVQARGDFMPSVTLSGSTSRQVLEFDDNTENRTHPKVGQVSLSQTLFAGGQNVSAYRSARNLHLASKASEEVTIQRTLISAVEAYMNVLRDEEILDLQENQVAVLNTQLRATNARFKQGEVTKTDVKQAEARLAGAKAQHVKAQGDLVTSETKLRNVLGVLPEDMEWPQFDFPLPAAVEDVRDEVLTNHPAIISALANLTSSKHLETRSKGTFLPTITATASASKNIDASGQDYDANVVGLNLSVPLFRGGKTFSEVRQAKSVKAQAQEQYEQTKRDVEQELVDAFKSFDTSKASLNSFQEAREAAQLAAEGIRREADLGERDVLDVLTTEQDLLQAGVDVTSAKRDMIVSGYRLFAAMGRLTTIPTKPVLSTPAVQNEGEEKVLEKVEADTGKFSFVKAFGGK